jgi:hypothetical protein
VRPWSWRKLPEMGLASIIRKLNGQMLALDSAYKSNPDVVTFGASDTTPTVAAGDSFISGGAVTITDFDNGVVGKTIKILAAHAVTVTDGSPIILHGSANFVMAAADTLTLHMFNDQVWSELSRMVN